MGEQGGMPSHFRRSMTQEVRFGELRPDPLHGICRHVFAIEQFACLSLSLNHQLFRINWRFKATAQSTLGTFIEVLE